jgi:hypothetical protein
VASAQPKAQTGLRVDEGLSTHELSQYKRYDGRGTKALPWGRDPQRGSGKTNDGLIVRPNLYTSETERIFTSYFLVKPAGKGSALLGMSGTYAIGRN